MDESIFTIGHSTHPLHQFIGLLKHHGITAVCDVRSTPYSRIKPQFNREKLKKALQQSGIAYVFLGKELGGRSEDQSCYVRGKVQYERIAKTELFQKGIERVREGMKRYRIALMCAEKDPIACHRSILICRNLRDWQIDIRHIIGHNSIETQIDLEKRLIAQLKLYPDLFKDTHANALTERAYEVQSDKIAYVENGEREQDEELPEIVTEEYERY